MIGLLTNIRTLNRPLGKSHDSYPRDLFYGEPNHVTSLIKTGGFYVTHLLKFDWSHVSHSRVKPTKTPEYQVMGIIHHSHMTTF